MNSLTFWGVQGSSAGAINEPDGYGTNTPCVSITHNNNLLIFDAGTGIKNLSNTIGEQEFDRVILFLTHSHWDHIQGFPFFTHIYERPTLDVFCHDATHIQMLTNQLNGRNFPIWFDDLPCTINPVSDVHQFHSLFGYSLEFISTNHPGNCVGYRIKHADFDICYIPDNQLRKTINSEPLIEQFSRFCNGTQILIHDSQFTEKDMPKKQNWGHSLVLDAFELAKQSNPQTFVMFHHDQFRQPGHIESNLKMCQSKSPGFEVIAAKEYASIQL